MVSNLTLDGMVMLANGVVIEQAVPPEPFRALVRRLHPVETALPLIRVGSDFDGGYLVPDDLAGLSACYSPGVSDNASFEARLAELGVRSHLADYSVDGPPAGFQPASFTKAFIGHATSETHITLSDWLARTGPVGEGDLLLQMDIEGAEYLSIIATPRELLARFRIIVMEVHYVEQWAYPAYFAIVRAMLDKLLADFHVVHNHPNASTGLVNVNGMLCPRLFELTLLRKDRARSDRAS